jgi:hypothetical protein
MKPFVTPSDQQLQRQLQKLIQQEKARQQQKAKKDIEAQLQKVEKQLDALESVQKAKKVAEKPKPKPATTTLQSVSKAISNMYKNYPKDLDTALNTFGYQKQKPPSGGGGGARTSPQKKKKTVQQMMDQDFRKIKQTTRLFLRSPSTPRATLVKTRSVLEKVLQKVPVRYHPDLTRLLVAVEARIVKT